MNEQQNRPTFRQELYKEMVLGTLIYAVVLGFFCEYTDFLFTKSFSTTFFMAIAMQLLTFATLLLKKWTVSKFKLRQSKKAKFGLVFFIWLIMFLSKFVFIASINLIFGESATIKGFFGIVFIVASMIIAKAIIELVYKKLGDNN